MSDEPTLEIEKETVAPDGTKRITISHEFGVAKINKELTLATKRAGYIVAIFSVSPDGDGGDRMKLDKFVHLGKVFPPGDINSCLDWLTQELAALQSER